MNEKSGKMTAMDEGVFWDGMREKGKFANKPK